MISKKGCIFTLLVLFILGLSIPLFTPNLSRVSAAGDQPPADDPTITTTTPTTTTTNVNINEPSFVGSYYLYPLTTINDSYPDYQRDDAMMPCSIYVVSNFHARTLTINLWSNNENYDGGYIDTDAKEIARVSYAEGYTLDDMGDFEDILMDYQLHNYVSFCQDTELNETPLTRTISIQSHTYNGLLIVSYSQGYSDTIMSDQDGTMAPQIYLSNYNLAEEITDSWDDGYDQGYEFGLGIGYDDGYSQALQDSENDITEYNNLMRIVFNGASNFLNTRIIGNITILHLILLPITLGVLIIIIKLVRG